MEMVFIGHLLQTRQLWSPCLTYPVGELCAAVSKHSRLVMPQISLLLATVPLRLLQLKSGTVCQSPSSHRHHCRLSAVN